MSNIHKSYCLQSLDRERKLIQLAGVGLLLALEEALFYTKPEEASIIGRELSILKGVFPQIYSSIDYVKQTLAPPADWTPVDEGP